jgi:AcrR family transcriptional regulator
MSRKAAPRRGRPPLSAAAVDEMRTRIADAARKLFRSEGYAAVSMRRLAQEVSVTPMTLYAYYDAKAAILRHLWAQIFDVVFDKVDAAATKARTPRARLRAASLAYVSYWLEHRDHYRMVFMTEGISQDDVGVFVKDATIGERFAVFTHALAANVSASTDTLKEKADMLLCGLHGIAHCVITMSSYPWTRPERLVDNLIDGLLDGR